MRAYLSIIWSEVLLLTLLAACGATAAEDVDPAVVGIWELTVPSPNGNANLVWDIRTDGTYEFRILGQGFPPGHTGMGQAQLIDYSD